MAKYLSTCKKIVINFSFRCTTQTKVVKLLQLHHHSLTTFPPIFLRPYGLAGPAPDHQTLQRRINPVCCKWLKRPHIAMSEFAATMVENFNFLATSGSTFVNNEMINQKRQNSEQFLQTLASLNTKNPQGSPQPEHVRIVMEKMYDDTDSLHQMMSEFFQIGGSMFTMAIQYLMARDLMCHPDKCADEMVATDHVTNQFKQEHSVLGLLHMLSTTCARAPPLQGASQSVPIETCWTSFEEQHPVLFHLPQHRQVTIHVWNHTTHKSGKCPAKFVETSASENTSKFVRQ